MSLTRCYKCVFDRTVRVKVIALITGLLLLVNAFHSVLPILPISAVQDVFRVSMTFIDNPFINEYNEAELIRKYRVMRGSLATVPDTYTMLRLLQNVTSQPGIFSPVELGYYSYSPLCIQNFYGIQPSLFLYKMTYMIVIVSLLLVVSVSYVVIVWHTHKVSKNAQQNANNQVNNNTKVLGAKVLLVIGSQLICWITVMVLMIVYGMWTNKYAPDLLYELTAVVLLPLNSFLNPIFNSSLYRKLLGLLDKVSMKRREEEVKEQPVIIMNNLRPSQLE